MVRKNVISELEKLKTMTASADIINQKQKDKLLKQISVVSQTVKVPKVKTNAQSQFVKTFPVDDEMADFAKWDRGSCHSRVDITRVICDYIKNNDLQNPENRKHIILNEPLKELLKVEVDNITYPQIQKYIGYHFIK